MSTILDALKKSERERKLDKVPTLGTMRPPEESRSIGRWILLSSLVVCLTAGVIAWLWLDSNSGGEVSTLVSGSPVAQLSSDASPRGAEEPVPEQVVVSQASQPVVADEGVVDLRNLSPSVASQLPDLTVSVISWSEGSDRNFVMMDSGIYRIGDVIGDGLVLEAIEPDSAVLNYMGRKIRVRP